MRLIRTWFGLALAAILGCGSAPEAPRGTGAREAAVEFFCALARQEWAEAFDKLDAESRKNTTLASFSARARAYRKNLGFELAKTQVRLCEEQGGKANAHLVLSDGSDALKRTYRDAVVLRKGPVGWAVVLPPNFGEKR
jgi:hypothetical protein